MSKPFQDQLSSHLLPWFCPDTATIAEGESLQPFELMYHAGNCNGSVISGRPKNVDITFWDSLKSRLKGVFAATQMAYMM